MILRSRATPWAEAFAQALGRGEELREPLRWVWRVAFRVAAGELKDRGRRLRTIPPQVSEMDEPAAELVAALGGLSPNQRAVLVLHYCAGYATKEIAAIIGSSPATDRPAPEPGTETPAKDLGGER